MNLDFEVILSSFRRMLIRRHNLTPQGFTTGESLMLLTMQDYGKFGVVQTEDRRKLFQIIQQQKQVKTQDPGTNKRMSSVIARLTSSGFYHVQRFIATR